MNPRLERLADDAWLAVFGEAVDAGDNARVHALAAHIREADPPWLRDLVPAHASLGVFFDPVAAGAAAVRRWLQEAVARMPATVTPAASLRTVEIPVSYGGVFGPDLEEVAETLGLSPTTVVERHAAGRYTVAMIGFAPGFPYLSGLDPTLVVPRRATPRTRVHAGSIGIGGAQTGIYPREGPGGWQLIGRTPLPLFDPAADPPSRLLPGDRVRFRPVDGSEAFRQETTGW